MTTTKLKTEWLPLLNYSSKHGVSLSTLRRRIKSNSIQFKLESGKYLILDETPQMGSGVDNPKPTIEAAKQEVRSVSPQYVEASVLSSANRLVEEIKSAYAKILQEKEEQIAQLKEEVVDLRMLVRILEDNPKIEKKPPETLMPKPEGNSNEDFFFSDFQTREI